MVDDVLIGDISMSEHSLNQLTNWTKEKVMTLPVKTTEERVPDNFYTVHQNRTDPAADVVRSACFVY